MNKHMTVEQVAQRYPRIIKAMQWQAILCKAEAAYGLRDYVNGVEFGGGEAIRHYCGGKETSELIGNAFKNRAIIRQITR